MNELKLMDLTLQDVTEAVKMREALMSSVVEAEHLIREVYDLDFDTSNVRISVWSDGNNVEYLTNDGVWQARYLNRSYDIPCTTEGIFEALKGEYFTADTPEVKERIQLCGCFKRFLLLFYKIKEEREKARSCSKN